MKLVIGCFFALHQSNRLISLQRHREQNGITNTTEGMIASSMGASTSPSQQNYNSFVRFCKFFSSRLVQVLVQARTGENVSQRCTTSFDQGDWFNLRIDELGEVSALLRQTITTYPPRASDLSIDFLLYTADGEFLPLESWHLSVKDEGESEEKLTSVRTQLYHQMSVLLKSAMAAARVTPMFRYYVRHQSADTFIIFYRVYEGRPDLDLGEGQKFYSIGNLKSPYGTISLELRYRTKMEIERSLKQHPEGKENECPKQLHSYEKEKTVEEGLNYQRVSIPFASVRDESSNQSAEEATSQGDAYSSFSVSPASQAGFSRTGSVSSRLSFRIERSVSSSDESNVFGVSSSPRVGEYFTRGISPFCREGQPPRTGSLPFFALLTASTSSVIFRSQPKALYKVPEHEPIGQRSSPVDRKHSSSSDASVHSEDTPSNEAVKDERLLGTPATESEDRTEEETIRASTVSTVVASTVGRSSRFCGNKRKGQSVESYVSSDEDDTQMPFAADISSDDSFVKVPFGSAHEGDGSDLGDFVHLFRLAQQMSIAFSIDHPELIHDQLARFESQQSTFDRFLASLVHPEDRESCTESYGCLKPKFF
uniref:Autophagy-related protein 13 n=1 Tax=Ascaris lumbricoides TaxID=6252 RepID=A0A0M3I1F4_ASCLU